MAFAPQLQILSTEAMYEGQEESEIQRQVTKKLLLKTSDTEKLTRVKKITRWHQGRRAQPPRQMASTRTHMPGKNPSGTSRQVRAEEIKESKNVHKIARHDHDRCTRYLQDLKIRYTCTTLVNIYRPTRFPPPAPALPTPLAARAEVICAILNYVAVFIEILCVNMVTLCLAEV